VWLRPPTAPLSFPPAREALERLLRYGLRAPFSQERLSRRPDGKVVYRLRRPWPNPQGATALVLEPLDFLRRLAALVSFPYSHQVRRHGVFANRSRLRRFLPPPPTPRDWQGTEATAAPAAENGGHGGPTGKNGAPSRASCPRLSWAQLLRRVLSIDALACPNCSTRDRPVPMVVLAFLTDPDVVAKILRHLRLPTSAPAVTAVKSATPALGFDLPEEDCASKQDGDDAGESHHQRGHGAGERSIRPPP